MKMWSSLSYAVGLLFLLSLNGVRLLPNAEPTTSDEDSDSIYCMLDNCPANKTKPHYGCNFTEKWSASCGKEPKLIPMSNKIKGFLISRHNTFRDFVAQGNPLNLPVAGRMYKLSWNSDLADLAELLIMRCQLKPTDRCISTMKHSNPGSNTAYNKFKTKQDAYRIVRSQLNAWYDEYKRITPQSLTDGSSPNNSEVGHFLRMMVGPSNRLGCAMAETEIDGWNYQWLTCLYSCSPQNNTAVYTVASKAASSCTTGVDGKFQHLCSQREIGTCCCPKHDNVKNKKRSTKNKTTKSPVSIAVNPTRMTFSLFQPGIGFIRNLANGVYLVLIKWLGKLAKCTTQRALLKMNCFVLDITHE